MSSVSIPKEQQAAVRVGSGDDATAPIKMIPVEQPGPGEILVKINWTGLCASDKSLIHDEWAGFGLSMMDVTRGIAGHEGAGVSKTPCTLILDLWLTGYRMSLQSDRVWRTSGKWETVLVLNGSHRRVEPASSA